MAQEYLPLAVVWGAIVIGIIGTEVGLSPATIIAMGVPVCLTFVLIWWYSPLPNRSTFVLDGEPMMDTQSGYWGFSRDEDE